MHPTPFLFPSLISSQETQEQDGSSDSLLEEWGQPEQRAGFSNNGRMSPELLKVITIHCRETKTEKGQPVVAAD